ncbi:hypothetical protein CDAR_455521 [Caerostris darwini]|uniref:Uncharacterized protein n=1 Tax=Caerostris darwini TaxID=1538125 RepID=A0AAV4MW85_9ARAC|nr:hypothetical protein CDAR_455521 [Caerostris darwini]
MARGTVSEISAKFHQFLSHIPPMCNGWSFMNDILSSGWEKTGGWNKKKNHPLCLCSGLDSVFIPGQDSKWAYAELHGAFARACQIFILIVGKNSFRFLYY